jgi:hypothetical protein
VINKSKSSLLLFDIVSTTFIPEKISLEKRCRSLGPLPNFGRFMVTVDKCKNKKFCVAIAKTLSDCKSTATVDQQNTISPWHIYV